MEVTEGREIVRMNKKTFGIGVILGVAVCIAFNIYSFTQIEYLCLDCPVSYGLPFRIAEIGGFARPVSILWGGLIANLLIYIGAGILLIAAGKTLFRKPRRPRLDG